MMKTIHLIRHAKSSWDLPGLSDQQRPLSPRGERDCQIMAAALYEAEVAIDKVYCSVAQRAQLTIQGLAEHWPGRPLEWQVLKPLYTFSSHQIWQLINSIDDEFNNICLVGHNPAFTDFINEASNSKLSNLPTCAYARLDFKLDQWQLLTANAAVLKAFLKPKMCK